jgi:hypothetical protein
MTASREFQYAELPVRKANPSLQAFQNLYSRNKSREKKPFPESAYPAAATTDSSI